MLMKNFVLIVLSLLSLTTYAQNNDDKFVAEGKTWTIFHYPLSKEYQYAYRMQLKGDTVISDVTYKKLYQGNTYNGALREDGEKVYYREKDCNEVCLYDFGLAIGGSLGDLTVVSKENKTYLGQERTTLELRSGNETTTEWVRGIGSLSRPDLNTVTTGNNDCLVTCIVNNDTIYKDLEMYNLVTNVTPIKISEDKNASIYDLSGRKLSAKPEKGLYIKNKRKFLVQ